MCFQDGEEWKQGLVMMFSFWFFGAIPVAGFAIVSTFVDEQVPPPTDTTPQHSAASSLFLGAARAGPAVVVLQGTIFAVDCVITLLAMFALGVAKAKVTNENIIYSPSMQLSLKLVERAVNQNACGAGF